MKKQVIPLSLLFVLSFFLASTPPEMVKLRPHVATASLGLDDDPDAQAEMDFMMLRDPVANRVPDNILKREQLFAKTLPRAGEAGLAKRNGTTTTVTWVERGPSNIGGRSRAFAADIAN